MEKDQSIDSFTSFENAKKKIDKGFKSGQLSRERAHQVLKDARKNYSSQYYNKWIEKHEES